MMGGGINKPINMKKQEVTLLSEQAIQQKIDYIVDSQLWDKIEDEGQRAALLDLFKKYSNNLETDRALGAIFGCLIGDALGAYCEFNKSISKEVLNQAMTMPGGGTFGLRAGQYTDDSELAFHLLTGLLTFDEKQPLKMQEQSLLAAIAGEYVNWYKSSPFDIGITCRKGLHILQAERYELKDFTSEQWQSRIFSKIMDMNADSQSNGSLMRIAPMAVFLSLIGEQPINHLGFITNEIKLMHPNPVLQEAGASWVHTLHLLIQRKGNNSNEFKTILQKIQSEPSYSKLQDQGWFSEAKQKHAMKANVNMGWAKIAWSYGIRILNTFSDAEGEISQDKLNSEFYRRQLEWIIEQAGDTDTNAAIVGGLIGSIIGFRKLPLEYLDCIFKLRFPGKDKGKKERLRNDRDPRYEPINVLFLALRLIEKCKAYAPVQAH